MCCKDSLGCDETNIVIIVIINSVTTALGFFRFLLKSHLKRSCHYFIFSLSDLFLAKIFQYTYRRVLLYELLKFKVCTASSSLVVFQSSEIQRTEFSLKILSGKSPLQECLS